MSSAIDNLLDHAPSQEVTGPASPAPEEPSAGSQLPARIEDEPAPLAALVDKARAYARAARAPSTGVVNVLRRRLR